MASAFRYLDRNARLGGQIPCPLCGGTLRGESCIECYAPAEVIESIFVRPHLPRIIGILGPSGVGKTVYLGMLLDMLSHGFGPFHGMARGPFSLALQRQVMLSLERQRFPEKTPVEADRWHWVHCEVTTGKRSGFDLVTPDVAGEAVASELESPGTHATIRTLIDRCGGLVVLIDTVGVIADGQSQEMFAMQLITYLESLHGQRRRKLSVPVALVFTKADLCEEVIDDPTDFARAHASALWRMCEARLRSFQFFCSSVAGSCGRLVDRDGSEMLIPLRIEPKGVVEPFIWLAGLMK